MPILKRAALGAALCVAVYGLWAVIYVTGAMAPALAQDRGAWFKSLKQPGTGLSCCDISDCVRTEAEWSAVGADPRVKGGGWSAIVPGLGPKLQPIPNDKVLVNKPSIDGDAYVCSNKHTGAIYCFVPPNMGF